MRTNLFTIFLVSFLCAINSSNSTNDIGECTKTEEWKMLAKIRAENGWHCEMGTDHRADPIAYLLFYSRRWFEYCWDLRNGYDAIVEFVTYRSSHHQNHDVEAFRLQPFFKTGKKLNNLTLCDSVEYIAGEYNKMANLGKQFAAKNGKLLERIFKIRVMDVEKGTEKEFGKEIAEIKDQKKFFKNLLYEVPWPDPFHFTNVKLLQKIQKWQMEIRNERLINEPGKSETRIEHAKEVLARFIKAYESDESLKEPWATDYYFAHKYPKDYVPLQLIPTLRAVPAEEEVDLAKALAFEKEWLPGKLSKEEKLDCGHLLFYEELSIVKMLRKYELSLKDHHHANVDPLEFVCVKPHFVATTSDRRELSLLEAMKLLDMTHRQCQKMPWQGSNLDSDTHYKWQLVDRWVELYKEIKNAGPKSTELAKVKDQLVKIREHLASAADPYYENGPVPEPVGMDHTKWVHIVTGNVI